MEVIKASAESKSVSESEPSKDFREEGELLQDNAEARYDVLCDMASDLEHLRGLCLHHGLVTHGNDYHLILRLADYYHEVDNKVIAESKSKSDSSEKVDNKVANLLAMNLAVLIRSQVELLKQAETDYQFDLIRATLEIGG